MESSDEANEMNPLEPVEILRDDRFIFDCYKLPEQSEYHVYIYDTNQPLPTRIGIAPELERALTLRIFRAVEKPTVETIRTFCQRFLDDTPFRISWIRRKHQEAEKLTAG